MAKRPPDPRASGPFWQDMFERAAREPMCWLLSAQDLKIAADIIHGKEGLGRVNLFLAGLALENLVKGICIGRDPAMVDQGKLKKWQGSGHELEELVSRAKLRLTGAEIDLLERLSEFILWAGRYPIAKTFEDQMPRTLRGGGFGRLTHWWPTNDSKLINELFERFCGLLEDERRMRQRGP